ncbi:hypothetical protein Goshw_010780 [Gossypium schwendimanii]|uniref:Uncharacterized protein n=1 Tax=Gossypium schwendimanii TaxID=34291 RepID=A0A7J9MBL7_GOSSC|nr:hypothetical protein [Gossypium schwendimanii]
MDSPCYGQSAMMEVKVTKKIHFSRESSNDGDLMIGVESTSKFLEGDVTIGMKDDMPSIRFSDLFSSNLTRSKLMELTLLRRHDHEYRLAQIKGLRSMGLGCWLVGDQGGIVRIIRKDNTLGENGPTMVDKNVDGIRVSGLGLQRCLSNEYSVLLSNQTATFSDSSLYVIRPVDNERKKSPKLFSKKTLLDGC